MARIPMLTFILLANTAITLTGCGPVTIRPSNQTQQDTVRRSNDLYDPVIPNRPMVDVPLTDPPPRSSSSASAPAKPLNAR